MIDEEKKIQMGKKDLRFKGAPHLRFTEFHACNSK